jgi:hypothetical protein
MNTHSALNAAAQSATSVASPLPTSLYLAEQLEKSQAATAAALDILEGGLSHVLSAPCNAINGEGVAKPAHAAALSRAIDARIDMQIALNDRIDALISPIPA